jgi:hypothetical protein
MFIRTEWRSGETGLSVENKAEIPEASPRGTCEAGLDVYKRWLFLLVALDPRRRGSGFHPNYGPKLIG